MAAKRHAVFRRSKGEAMIIAGQVAIEVGREEVNLVIATGTEPEGNIARSSAVKLRFVERNVTVGGNRRAQDDTVFLGRVEIIGQEPPADVHLGRREVSQLDGISRRSRIAVGQRFIDNHLWEGRRSTISLPWRAIHHTARTPTGRKSPSVRGGSVVDDDQ